jgi:hypothetical protein
MIRVAGVAVGRYQMADGRPGDPPEDVAAMVARFAPGTVPILSRHRGVLLGYLDSVTAEHGRDLRFTGEVVEYPDLVERLLAGAGISIETANAEEPTGIATDSGITESIHTQDDATLERGARFVDAHPHWRGVLGVGANLVGLALSDAPAAAGSIAWVDGGVPPPRLLSGAPEPLTRAIPNKARKARTARSRADVAGFGPPRPSWGICGPRGVRGVNR